MAFKYSFTCPKCGQTKSGTALNGRNVITYCCGTRHTSESAQPALRGNQLTEEWGDKVAEALVSGKAL